MCSEDLIFDNPKTKELFESIIKKISLDKKIYNIQLEWNSILPEDEYIDRRYIKDLIAIYNLAISKKTKTILVPVYNLPMI